jgi:putative salt-induced outer membrane protein YdiY
VEITTVYGKRQSWLRKTAVFASLLGIIFSSAQAAAQHTLTLTNGDQLTGTFNAIDGGVWKFDYLGQTQNIVPGNVASLTIDSPLGWRLSDGTIVSATLTATGNRATLSVVGGQTRSVNLSDIEALGSASDLEALVPLAIGLFSPIKRFWSAVASLGVSSKSGNSRARGFATTLEFERKTDRDRIDITLGAVREESSTDGGPFETTVSRYTAGARGEVFASGDFFTFLQTRFERDSFQDLSLRSSNNIGIGFRPIATGTTDLRISGSGGFQYESFTTNGTLTDAIAVIGSNLGQTIGPASLRWQLEVTTLPRELSDYRLRSDASVTISVIKGLGFRVGILNEYDNNPRPGVKSTDTLVSTTLTYALGR